MLLNCYQSEHIEAGCDEAGRGCLAGPVFAAAVILPSDFIPGELTDSKKLTHQQRCVLREIIEREAIAWAVASVETERRRQQAPEQESHDDRWCDNPARIDRCGRSDRSSVVVNDAT